MNKRDILVLAVGSAAIGAVILGVYAGIKDIQLLDKNITKQVYFTKDLNRDGRDDLISESVNGYKVPLYAVVNPDGSIRYVSGDEMKKIDPTTAYETIEDMLNKK